MAGTFPKYTQWLVQSSATSISTITAETEHNQQQFSSLVLRLNPAATGNVYWGGSDVTNTPTNAGGLIRPGEGVTWDASSGHWFNSAKIYFVGTASSTDILFITRPA